MWSVFSSFIGSAFLAFLLVFLYKRSGKKYRRNQLFARDLWWLPGWKCWRFVIRNMEGRSSLHSLRFKAWLREIEPNRPGCSVNTFLDNDLTEGHRFLLPKEQDLPILCFRFEANGDKFEFIKTNKLGDPESRFTLQPGRDYYLMAEYTFQVRTWYGVPLTVARLLSVPRYVEDSKRKTIDLFKAIQEKQGNSETTIAVTFTEDECITIPPP